MYRLLPFLQVVAEDVIDNLIAVCHSDSYEKLEKTIKVRNGRVNFVSRAYEINLIATKA